MKSTTLLTRTAATIALASALVIGAFTATPAHAVESIAAAPASESAARPVDLGPTGATLQLPGTPTIAQPTVVPTNVTVVDCRR